jgi:tetraprenyl-beta-curcumene synthase
MDYRPSHSTEHSYRTARTRPDPLDAIALLRVQATYWLEIYPQARRELAGWERRASGMPGGTFREHALAKLTGERLNAEGAALFAVLAPRRQRRQVVRLLVSFQVLYDYLDAVNEDPAHAELESGLQLHRVLTDAVIPDPSASAHYPHDRIRAIAPDGGYTLELTRTCKQVMRTLPAAACSVEVLKRATERCAQAQSHNHATLVSGESGLISWSVAQVADGREQPWWELAAAGVSSLAIHALLASAADAASTREDAARIDAAYFPSICALSTLLDSLADYDTDADSTNHSFIARYRDADHAAERLVAIAAEAAERIKPLRNGRAHAIILAGIVAYYLSSISSQEGFPATAAEALSRHVGPLEAPMRAALRARRYLHGRSAATRPSVRDGSLSARNSRATPEARAVPVRARR